MSRASNNLQDLSDLQNKIYCKYLCPLDSPKTNNNDYFPFQNYMKKSKNNSVFQKIISFYVINLPCKYILPTLDSILVYFIVNVLLIFFVQFCIKVYSSLCIIVF